MIRHNTPIRIYVRVSPFYQRMFQIIYGSTVVRSDGNRSQLLHTWMRDRLRRRKTALGHFVQLARTEEDDCCIAFEFSHRQLLQYGQWMKLGTKAALEKHIQRDLRLMLRSYLQAKLGEAPKYGELTRAVECFRKQYQIEEDDYSFEAMVKEWQRQEA
ncbi:MAG: hypothetical protein C0424_10480 [Sphingobacteriaceae bacterium]|nr:hypothetical protein [Sphingobacteriaceae bacterium]